MELKYDWLREHEGFGIEEYFVPDVVCLKYKEKVISVYRATDNPLLTEDFLKGEVAQLAKINYMARETTQSLK